MRGTLAVILLILIVCALTACGSPQDGSQSGENGNLLNRGPSAATSQDPSKFKTPEDDGLPAFDTNAYCQTIGATAGGSFQIVETCRQAELNALSQLRKFALKARPMTYCREIGDAIGGSYQIMLACVEEEIEAAKRS